MLDLGGLSTSATDACVVVQTNTAQPIQNVVIQNGAIMANVADCVYLVATTACTIDNVTMVTKAQSAFVDVEGSNLIKHCIFVAQNPNASTGPYFEIWPTAVYSCPSCMQ